MASSKVDMVDTDSLSHLLNGKALKALSDGGVDFYAVAAAIWFGKQIAVRPSLESSVRSHIESRDTVKSVQAEGLSIGWGHSAVASDMTRTKAGSNALLLIGALATGTPPCSVAPALSELMSLSGCDAEDVPNTDVLEQMVSYLAPFVYDLGFSEVLERVNTAGLRAIARQGGDSGSDRAHLEFLGTPAAWAAAVKRLLQAKEKDESIYLVTKFRGSWLAAFASHILGMTTEVHLGDVNVWNATGDRGRVVFQLSTSSKHADSTIIDSPAAPRNAPKRIEVDYLLGDALEALVNQEEDVPEQFLTTVQRAISREAYLKLSKLMPTNGLVTRKTLDEVLRAMGISEEASKDIDVSKVTQLAQVEEGVNPYLRRTGLDHLTEADWTVLTDQCEQHRGKAAIDVLHNSDDTTKHCICGKTGDIILGFACSALALMFCNFDATKVRFQGSVLTGSHVTAWSRHLAINDRVGEMRFEHILIHIIRLVSSSGWVDSAVEERRPGAAVVGLSTGSQTVAYTGIMQKDTFDEAGRFLTLKSGRASFKGVLRPTIFQTDSIGFLERPADQKLGTAIAAGTSLEPQYQSSSIDIKLTTKLTEDAIIVDTLIGAGSKYERVLMEEGLRRLFFSVKVPECSHDIRTPFKVEEGQDLSVSGFILDGDGRAPQMQQAVFALQGNKLEQLLICSTMSRGYEKPVLQLRSCLQCSVEAALDHKGPAAVIIGA